ncbi:MAG: transposase [Treponema sp.]|jgi:REP element-mobilizing transposase RayT|nr:transposase [Treponema sp.]
MRHIRVLGRGVWYGICTRINNREPLFRRPEARRLLAQVFRQAKERYGFKVRALRMEEDRLSFCIMPADGLQLPGIMKWLKQVFAQRFNGLDGRIGHLWGDRYKSELLDGESPEEAGKTRVRPLYREAARNPGFLLFFPHNQSHFSRPAPPRPG